LRIASLLIGVEQKQPDVKPTGTEGSSYMLSSLCSFQLDGQFSGGKYGGNRASK